MNIFKDVQGPVTTLVCSNAQECITVGVGLDAAIAFGMLQVLTGAVNYPKELVEAFYQEKVNRLREGVQAEGLRSCPAGVHDATECGTAVCIKHRQLRLTKPPATRKAVSA